jgi:ParB/RepB/Spo0J family partition protein
MLDSEIKPELSISLLLHSMVEVDLPLDSVVPSSSAAQARRRALYSQAALEQLAVSMAVRQLQAIVVRRLPDQEGLPPRYEIVLGERRWRAARIAGLKCIRATIRTLTDAEALHDQLVENKDREELNELAEAEGYAELMQLDGCTIEEVAARFGQKRKYVSARLILLKLCEEARKAFCDRLINLGVATLLARIPVEALQKDAPKDVTKKDWREERMSVRDAQKHIEKKYMLALSDAPFKTNDATLVPEAGPCARCPKRTGNARDLFDDIKSRDVCTDPVCFAKKREATANRRRDEAKENNQTIIEGKEAKKIAPYGTHNLQGGFVSLDQPCYQDKRQRTYRQLLGKDGPVPTVLQVPDSGDYIDVVSKDEITPLLKKRGILVSPAPTNSSRSPEERARVERARNESQYRERLFLAIHDKIPSNLGAAHFKQIAERFFDRIGYEDQKRLMRLWKWEPPKGGHSGHLLSLAEKQLGTLSEPQITRFIFDCALISELNVSPWSSPKDKPVRLLAAAKLHKIDAAQIRKTLDRERKSTMKPTTKKSKQGQKTGTSCTTRTRRRKTSPRTRSSAKPASDIAA